MTRYLISANLWLIFAVVTFLGRTYAPSDGTNRQRYSFFHAGQWFSAESYTLLVLALVAVAAFFFVLTWKTRNKS
ncbi:MAG: hypothetical protein ABJC04_12930 [Verrucomicrobiota bacterium]